MSKFTGNTEARAPSRDEVERILAHARQLRAQTLRHLMVSGWAMVRRTVTRRHPARPARHA